MTATIVSPGVTTSGLTVSSGDQLLVFAGGVTSNITIDSGGYEVVSNGGTAIATEVQAGGYVIVLPEGDAAGTVLDGGIVLSTGVIAVQPDGTVATGSVLTGYTISSGGAEYILPNSVASASVISDGGNVIVYSAGTSFGTTVVSGGAETAYFGAITSNSLVEAGGSSLTLYGSALNTTVEGIGASMVIEGAYASGTVISGGGSAVVGGDSTAIDTVVSAGGIETIYYATATDATIADSGTLELRTSGLTSGSIFFTGSGGLLQIDDSSAVPVAATVISGFSTGDRIDFDFIGSGAGDSVSVAGDVVTVSAGGTSYDLTIDGAVAGGLQLGAATDGSLDLIAVCYLEGTRILTPTGERAVEALAIGDSLVSRFHGMRRIKWIGRQSYAARFVKTNRDQIPVRIAADALGDRLPARELFVSPGHSMLVGDTLLLAKCLVNGVTITQDVVPEEIHYHQIEFETHDCVIAEGTWSETYADVEGLRARFHNAAEFKMLYPDDRAPQALSLCAPRPERGPALDAALRPLIARASLGLTPGPLRGSIDAILAGHTVEGWAQDTNHPEMPVLLEVLLDETVIGTILACDHRADLQAAGLGQGRCAFTFVSPVEITATVRVRRASDGGEIAMSSDCLGRFATRAA